MLPTAFEKQIWNEHRAFSLVLIFAFGLGLLFVILVPPWQHYDEPTHFEYAWLIANRPNLPQVGDYDQEMRRKVAASMMEHGFFKGLDFTPNLLAIDTPIWIGISQTNDPPLYYWVVAIPLRLMKTSDITIQLYLGRLVSLLFYLVSILSAYGVIVELTRPGSPMRWIIPLSIAMLPSFVDLMTAINNEVGATALFSLFLWCAVVLLRRGFSIPWMAGLVISGLLCWWVKNTVVIAVLLIPVVLVLSGLRGRWNWAAWGIIGLAAVLGLFSLFSGGDAAFWFRDRTQVDSVRVTTGEVSISRFALQLTLKSRETPAVLFQIIPVQTTYGLRGKIVSLGAWIWANQPQMVRSPILDDGTHLTYSNFDITVQPTFHVITATVGSDTSRLRIILSPISGSAPVDNTIYYSGLILAMGERPANELPLFSNPDASQGNWGSQPFRNLLLNPIAEDGWVRLRPWVENFISKKSPLKASLILPSLLDLRVSKGYYRATAMQLFRTFWAKFGWGQVPLLGEKPFRVLAVISLASLMGSVLFVLRSWRRLPWKVIFVMGLATVTIWGATIVRGISVIDGGTWLPAARYAYPAIIPTMLVFSTGLLELLRIIGGWLHISAYWQGCVYFILFTGLDLLAVVSIYTFYY